MDSFKKRTIFFVLGIVVLIAISSFMLFSYTQLKAVAIENGETKARADLNIAETILDLKYPGFWSVRNGELYKGTTDINNNFSIVDDIEKLTGNTCAIFLKNICVSTTVPMGDCDRATGIYAPYEVTSKVFEVGPQYYTGQAVLAGKMHQTAYKPLKNEYGEIIGVLYIGVPISNSNDLCCDSTQVGGATGIALTLVLGFSASNFFARSKSIQELAATNTFTQSKPQNNNEGMKLQPEYTAASVPAEESAASERVPEQIEKEMECFADKGEEWFDAWLNLKEELPKGLNLVTLKQIVLFLKQQKENESTIQELSEAVCLSKVTVRRYFDYLHDSGLVDMEQKYGSVGRPLRIYKLKA